MKIIQDDVEFSATRKEAMKWVQMIAEQALGNTIIMDGDEKVSYQIEVKEITHGKRNDKHGDYGKGRGNFEGTVSG